MRPLEAIEIPRALSDKQLMPTADRAHTVVIFHGFGADAQDLVSLSRLAPHLRWIFPQGPLEVPLAAGIKGRAWFPVNIALLQRAMQQRKWEQISQAFPEALDQITQQVELFLEQLNLSRKDVLLGGFSQGAVLAVETALKGKEPCAGLLIFSGTLIKEFEWRRLAPQHASTAFFQSHGISDPLLPLHKAEELERLLRAAGLSGEFLAFPGGHEIPTSVLRQAQLFLKRFL